MKNEGSKALSKRKKIGLENALSGRRGLESALGKDWVCKVKDYLCEKLKDFSKWYSCTRQPA